MTIYEQLIECLKDDIVSILSTREIKARLVKKFGTNPDSIIISDYCYNRYNSGISFNKHLFIYIDKSTYRYVGENYNYTGLVFHKPKGSIEGSVIGEWDNGKLYFYSNCASNKEEDIGIVQIKKLYGEYLEILRFEMNVLGFKATELRHLIGRLGEFYCVMHINGTLVKVPNQQGYDVLKNNRRISVKTTAQRGGFISINKNTYDKFDDLFVVQFIDKEFRLLFYDSKEKMPKPRLFDNRYEVDIRLFKNT